jgi:FtsP/CotA-like multicopper oxidase with cupredoxin domain
LSDVALRNLITAPSVAALGFAARDKALATIESCFPLSAVRIPGPPMTVVQADGNDVESIIVDEFRMGVAETYDVIVRPDGNTAYSIFAQAEDRTGFARGTLTPRLGLTATVPAMDPRPRRTMMDMGMGNMGGMQMSDIQMGEIKMSGVKCTDGAA